MADLSGTAAVAGSCPLLDKLAPETRVRIYEYVLFFEKPVKHAKNMRPFIEKITDSKAGSDAESNFYPPPTYDDSSEATESLCPINTSILSTNKLIYTEAVKVFYENNVIQFDVLDSERRSSVRLRETDLSLATRVITKVGLFGKQAFVQSEMLGHVMIFILKWMPLVCPGLRAGTVYIYTDIEGLFNIAHRMRDVPSLQAVSFEGVGRVAASVKGSPCRKVFVLCKEAIERWEAKRLSHSFLPNRISARGYYDRSREGSEGRDEILEVARDLFDTLNVNIVPPDYPVIADDSHEFWTVVDEILGFTESDDEFPELQEETLDDLVDLDQADHHETPELGGTSMNELLSLGLGLDQGDGDDELPELGEGNP